MQNSSYDGRARRTLKEAFGPYTSSDFIETDPPGYPRAWWVLMAIVGIATAVTVVVLR